ncbi:MAG: DUF3524 domain-containing protein [Caldilineaceae bacterium]|nr:DUF3524 domain-containing protein [Caldilineaceae bacterium]
MHVWLVSPYHTGSHQAWAEGYLRHSRHEITLLTMAGRFWKWRMQGGAVELASQARRALSAHGTPAAILATDMVHVPALLGLLRRELDPSPPVILYMHENQLTYPWRPGEGRDLTYAVINWLSQLCADAVVFNSRYHLDSWLRELPHLLKHFPDYNHLSLVSTLRAHSHVLPVGVALPPAPSRAPRAAEQPPLILWNQRWEYDKRPDRFFALLYRLQNAGIPFRLAVAGENFRNEPAEFEEARTRLSGAIEQWGFVASRPAYEELLRRADLVISTADHEFFGISVLEAVAAGALPLLPRRLSYPELIPAEFHSLCLYDDEEELFAKASQHLTQHQPAPPALRAHVVQHYSWPAVAAQYDALLATLASATNTT